MTAEQEDWALERTILNWQKYGATLREIATTLHRPLTEIQGATSRWLWRDKGKGRDNEAGESEA